MIKEDISLRVFMTSVVLQCGPVEPAPGPSSVSTEARDTAGPFGPGLLDYVSDSQLNSISLR